MSTLAIPPVTLADLFPPRPAPAARPAPAEAWDDIDARHELPTSPAPAVRTAAVGLLGLAALVGAVAARL